MFRQLRFRYQKLNINIFVLLIFLLMTNHDKNYIKILNLLNYTQYVGI